MISSHHENGLPEIFRLDFAMAYTPGSSPSELFRSSHEAQSENMRSYIRTILLVLERNIHTFQAANKPMKGLRIFWPEGALSFRIIHPQTASRRPPAQKKGTVPEQSTLS